MSTNRCGQRLAPEERENRRSSFREWGPPLPCPLLLLGRRGRRTGRDRAGVKAQPQPFEVGDGLLEDVAENIDINDRPDFGVLVRVGQFARGAVVVIAEVLEMSADLVRHLEAVQTLI